MQQPLHFLGVALSPGVRRRNLLVYLFVALVSSGYAGLLAILEPGLLQVMAVPFAEQGPVTGNLRVLQELVYILLLGVFGALADRWGRRPIYVFGLATTAVGYCLYPFASNLTELAIYRVVIAVGGAAMIGMLVTVIADYTRDETRGKANGLQALMTTLGAFVPPILGFFPKYFVDQGFSEREAMQASFALAGGLGAVAALAAWAGLANIRASAQQVQESLGAMLRQGLSAARDSRIALSYGAAFISRGDLAVTGAFMGLWLVQVGVRDQGMEPSQAMWELSVPRVITVVCGALIGALLMGYLSDRISRVRAVSFASGLAAVVYLAIYLVADPTADWVFGLLFMMGIAEISAWVSSQALVGQYAPAARRGAVIGLFGVAGAFGILVGSGGGGWLFKHVGPHAPFILFGFLNLLVFLWSLRVRERITQDARVPDLAV